MVESDKRHFLTRAVPELLDQLHADTQPAFGLMTAQHMIEHLTVVIKSSVKRYGQPQDQLSQRQEGFQRFLAKGAILKHRPSNNTRSDLPALKYDSLQEAKAEIPVAIERFYKHYEDNPNYKAYNEFFGELGFEQLELFHYQHLRYHFWQFGLLDKYP